MALAMFEKDCEIKALIRSIRTDIINFSQCVSKMYAPHQIEPIPLIDNADMIFPIKNIEQALKLLKEFK